MSGPQTNTILVTVSRQFGSGGTYIAQQVAKRLGFRYVDREILGRATDYLGSEEETLAFREERVSGFLENLLRGFIYGPPEAAYVPPPLRPVYDIELFRTEAEIIKKIADRYDAVIVGRAAFHVLQGRTGLVKVFLHAPDKARIQRVMELYHILDPREAEGIVSDSDKQRRRFIETAVGVNWTDSRCYHLSVDSAYSGFAASEDMILRLVDTARAAAGR
jgi:cytidylate kinase